jgi:hypothetical protein
VSNTEVDRRRFPRTYLPIAASLFSGTTKVGDYLVADLSAGGALFAHGRAVEIGARLRVMFVGDGVEGLSVTAMVKRCELFRGESWSVAVEFGALPPSLVDALQDLVLDGMACARESAILLVHPKPLMLATLASDVLALGRRALLATTALEAMRWLWASEPSVEAVLIDQAWDAAFGREIFGLVREEFPAVHAIALGDATDRLELTRALEDANSVSFLEVPWSPSELRATLEDRSAFGQDSSSPSVT